MGISDSDERWLRLAILIYKTSVAAAKDELEKAISSYSGATFDDKLHAALLQNEEELSNTKKKKKKKKQHLLGYEIEKVFPLPPVASQSTYKKFDIGIVAKLIKFFVGETDWQNGTNNLPTVDNLRNFVWLNASPFALVELLRLFRNWVYHQTGEPPISKVEFNEAFDNLLNILKGLSYDVTDVVDLRTELLCNAREDVVNTVKDAIEAAQSEIKADFSGLKNDIASSWKEIKRTMSHLEVLLNALKDGLLTEDSLQCLWDKFKQYQSEAHTELFRKIEEVLKKLGDLSSIVSELKVDVASDFNVLKGGIYELLQKSEDAKLVLEKLETCVPIMADFMQALKGFITTLETRGITQEQSDLINEDQWRQAREACRTENERLINVREKNLFDEDIEGRTKAEMLVKLVIADRRDIDAVRRKTTEREAYLSRDFSSVQEVKPDSIFKKDHVVVVRGLPGAGKSTFCHYLLREWNAGRLWEDRYEFVFYLNSPTLRFSLPQEPFSLKNALHVLYPKVFKEISYDRLSERRYLIIVDAIDECDVDKICARGISSSFERAIMEAIASNMEYDRIIVGRPLACHDVHEKLLSNVNAQFVEVLGFSTEQIEEYVQMFYKRDKTKADAVWEKIRANHSLLGLAHLPVFANIICEVMDENDDPLFKIETVTELYVWACAIYFHRHLQKHHFNLQVRTFTGIFQEEALIKGLILDSKIAFEILTTGKIISESDDDLRLKTIYSTPFIIRKQQSLCFAHFTFVEFLCAVHLFTNPSKLDEVVMEERFCDVLPFLFGLLGGAVSGSDSPSIIQTFVKPLMKQLQPVTKHPLSGKIGRLLFNRGQRDLYVNLCFEFRNSKLLNDKNLFWGTDAGFDIQHHHELERLLFFMKHFHGRKVGIKALIIRLTDHLLSTIECKQLRECLSDGCWLRGRLGIFNCKLNDEQMKELSPAFCLFSSVALYRIHSNSALDWSSFVRCVKDARDEGELRLNRLELIDCKLNDEQMVMLSPAICLISSVVLLETSSVLTRSLKFAQKKKEESVSFCSSFVRCFNDARKKVELRLDRLELIGCYLDDEKMMTLCPTLCLISSVKLQEIRSSVSVWSSFVRCFNDARKKGELRLDRLELINCNLDDEQMITLCPTLCLISSVKLKEIRSSVSVWSSFVRCFNDARKKGELRLDRLELIDCYLDDEQMIILCPILCLISSVKLGSTWNSQNYFHWSSLAQYIIASGKKGELLLDRLELIGRDLSEYMMSCDDAMEREKFDYDIISPIDQLALFVSVVSEGISSDNDEIIEIISNEYSTL